MNLIYDTDIGTDVDDLIALVMLLGSEVTLLGVTTVYGDTALRSHIVKRTIAYTQLSEVPVVPGAEETLTRREVFWAGIEGEGLDLSDLEVDTTKHAVDFLWEHVNEDKKVSVLAVGPLTNIALALEREAFATHLERLYIMGGSFDDAIEHNIKSDPEAAQCVFGSGVPITLVPLDITGQILFDEIALATLTTNRNPLTTMLEEQILRWWDYIYTRFGWFSGRKGNSPHDPMAALALLTPDIYSYETGFVDVSLEPPGRTSFRKNMRGNIKLVTNIVQPERVTKEIIAQIGAVPVLL